MGYYICAIVTVKEGKLEEVKSVIDKIFENVQKNEPETLQYQIVQNSEKPNEIVVFEEYTNEAAFEFHKNSEAFQAFAKSIPKLCENVELKKVELQKRHFASTHPSKL